MNHRRPRADGDRPGSGESPVVTSPQLSGDPHTPRTPAGSRDADESLIELSEAASERLRRAALKSAETISRRDQG